MLDGTDLAAKLNLVILALNKLGLHILDELKHNPVWIDNGQGVLVNDRDKIIYAIKHFKPVQGLSPQETLACVGAVGGDAITANLIDSCNQAKDTFKSVVQAYMQEHSIKDTAVIRHLLAYNGFPGIKLKTVYRHIRWVNFHPRRVSFSKIKHNSNRVITLAQAEQKLLKAGKGQHIDVQLSKLSLLDHSTKLVIHRDVPDCWIANIATFKNQDGISENTHFNTSLPVFYLHNNQLPTPQVLFAQKNTRHKQVARADKRIEDTPFLPSICAYRYKS